MQVSVTFLGTGHGNVSAQRFQSSILLRWKDSAYLLDAGEPCAQRLRNLGEKPGDLAAVLITHGHADHVGGLPLLLQAAWGDGRNDPLPVALPASLEQPLLAWCRFTLGLLPKRANFGIETIPWSMGKTMTFGELQTMPRPTSHLVPPNESVLLDLRLGGKRIVYSGDIGAASDLSATVAERIDLLICELSHVEPTDLLEVLGDSSIDTLVLTHAAEEFVDRLEEIRAEFALNLPNVDMVYAAEDGLVIDL